MNKNKIKYELKGPQQPDDALFSFDGLFRKKPARFHVRLLTCQRHRQDLYENDRSAHSLLGKAAEELAGLADIDAVFKQAGELFDNALIQLQEGTDLLRVCEQQLELDPERLQWVEQRLDALHTLARKHRIESEQLPTCHERLKADIRALEQADQKLEELENTLDELAKHYRRTATRLHRQRVKTARSISAQVGEAMQTLGMQGGRFEIQVTDKGDESFPVHGTDSIEFLVSANPGQPLKALNKVASGGELSRISLAIQVATGQCSSIPTLIFDEVDVGIGGGVAEIVGQMLRSLGGVRQILCVTHLAQVAAMGHHHLQVAKHQTDGDTHTVISALEEDQRISEIARMLGGIDITDQTLAHAREMVQHSQEY